MHFTKRTAFNGKVLCKNVYKASVNGTVTGGYAFAREFFFILAEVGAAVFDKTVKFYKTALVQKKVNSFPGSQLTAGMLFFNALFAACLHNMLRQLKHFLNSFLSRQLCHLQIIYKA